MKQNLIGGQGRHTLDEAGFQQLLAAAFVVQQHNDRLRLNKGPGVSYTKTLAEIVETEEQIKNGRLSLPSALRLVVERARRLTRAEAAAIATVEGGALVYRATSGRSLDPVGSKVRLNQAIAAKCLNGGLLQSPDTTNDRNLDSELCWNKGVRSLLAAPITFDDKVIGVLELRFANPRGYREEDIRTCELLSGLVTAALEAERGGASQRQKMLAQRNEETAMMRAIEKITPQLDRMLSDADPDFERAGAALSGEIMGDTDTPPAAKRSSVWGNEKPRPGEKSVSGKQKDADGNGHGSPSSESGAARIIDVSHIPVHTFEAPRLEATKLEAARFEGTKLEAPTREPIEVRASIVEAPVAAAEPEKPREFVEAPPAPGATVEKPMEAVAAQSEPHPVAESCRNCGREFVGDESLCGVCGAPRGAEPGVTSAPAESTWASLWDLQEQESVSVPAPSSEVCTPALSDFALSNSVEAEENKTPFLGNLHDIRDRFTGRPPRNEQDPAVQPRPQAAAQEEAPAESELSSFSATPEAPAAEVSGSEDEEWTEPSLGQRIGEFWDYHRATIYLGIAAILLLMVLLGWGEQPTPAAASGPTQASANAGADLTLFEKMLVEMGLAEAPVPDQIKPGNPEAKVWEDVHTALYYCAGSDLYGKTKGGKYATQKEAQLDQFEPAGRRSCR